MILLKLVSPHVASAGVVSDSHLGDSQAALGKLHKEKSKQIKNFADS